MYQVYEVQENYMALAVAILADCPPETAWKWLDKGKCQNGTHHPDVSKDDDRSMVKLKAEGLTYKEIGQMFGLTKDAVYNRIRRITGRM